MKRDPYAEGMAAAQAGHGRVNPYAGGHGWSKRAEAWRDGYNDEMSSAAGHNRRSDQ